MEEFKEWCKSNTATFESDGEDDYNVSWDELAFYEELVKKVSSALSQARQEGRKEAMKEMGDFIWEHRTADDGETIFARFTKKALSALTTEGE